MGFFDRIFGLFGDSSVKAEASAMPALRPRGRAKSDAAVATFDAPADAPAGGSESLTDGWWAPEGALLLEPVAPVRPELSLEGRMLENVLISHFDGRDLSMPPLPRVPELVLRALRDRNCSFGRVAETISEDQVLAAAVLRMVNSPLYRGVQRITSLQQAVARLGASAVRQLMLQQSLKAVTFSGKGVARVLAERLWRHALASAWIMHALAEFSGDDADEAFLIGLLHNIGNVIVLRIVHNQDAFSHDAIDLDTFEYLCHESHQEFGELVAEAWNLPTKTKALIADHHGEPTADDPLRTERLRLQLANMVCEMLGYASPAAYDLLNARVAKALGLAERRDFLPFLASLPNRIEEAVAEV